MKDVLRQVARDRQGTYSANGYAIRSHDRRNHVRADNYGLMPTERQITMKQSNELAERAREERPAEMLQSLCVRDKRTGLLVPVAIKLDDGSYIRNPDLPEGDYLTEGDDYEYAWGPPAGVPSTN
jgi:hypothetical protein